jgi:Arc/MetJ-type ribon-helix-helix transcriptional regulator
MVRTQIQLNEEQKKKLKKIAAERGVSVAELIRQGVDAILKAYGRPERGEVLQRAAAAAGRFRSDQKSVAKDHDRYLDRAFSQ